MVDIYHSSSLQYFVISLYPSEAGVVNYLNVAHRWSRLIYVGEDKFRPLLLQFFDQLSFLCG